MRGAHRYEEAHAFDGGHFAAVPYMSQLQLALRSHQNGVSC
jgi:hypothetical protein